MNYGEEHYGAACINTYMHILLPTHTHMKTCTYFESESESKSEKEFFTHSSPAPYFYKNIVRIHIIKSNTFLILTMRTSSSSGSRPSVDKYLCMHIHQARLKKRIHSTRLPSTLIISTILAATAMPCPNYRRVLRSLTRLHLCLLGSVEMQQTCPMPSNQSLSY